MLAHWDATREQAGRQNLVLLIQDTTEVDDRHHPKTESRGPIGNGGGQGYLLQTVLAVVPEPCQVLGIAAQEPFLRQPQPKASVAPNGVPVRARARSGAGWLWQSGHPQKATPGCMSATAIVTSLTLACGPGGR